MQEQAILRAAMRHEQLHQFGHILGTYEIIVRILLILKYINWCPEGDLPSWAPLQKGASGIPPLLSEFHDVRLGIRQSARSRAQILWRADHRPAVFARPPFSYRQSAEALDTG